MTGCWCPIKAISGSIVLAQLRVSSVAGANCVIEPAVASVTLLSWSHPHCHAVTPCHESRDMSGRMTLFVCDGLPIREPPDILTSGSQRMTVSGTSRGSPDSRPSSIYGDINKSHSSRYESKFHCKSHIWESLKLINVGNLYNLKAFCVWTEHWTALCLFRHWAKLATITSNINQGLVACFEVLVAWLCSLMTILMLSLMFTVVGCEALNKMLNMSSSMSSSSSASYNKYNSLDRCHNGVKHRAIMLSPACNQTSSRSWFGVTIDA